MQLQYGYLIFTSSTVLKIKLLHVDSDIQQTWFSSREAVKATHRLKESTWISWFVCVTWLIWKEHNARIFRGKEIPSWILADCIFREGQLWLKFC